MAHSFVPLTEQELCAMSTKRILAYQRSIMAVPETGSIDPDTHRLTARIYSKDDVRFQELRNVIRRILADREHVESKNG